MFDDEEGVDVEGVGVEVEPDDEVSDEVDDGTTEGDEEVVEFERSIEPVVHCDDNDLSIMLVNRAIRFLNAITSLGAVSETNSKIWT